MKVLDTTFLIDLLRGKKETFEILNTKDPLLTTQINMYEVIRGIFLKKESKDKLIQSLELFDNIKVLSLDDSGIIRSAEISAEMIEQGTIISQTDCLIAGITLSKGINTIVTRNVKHFERIKGLKIESY